MLLQSLQMQPMKMMNVSWIKFNVTLVRASVDVLAGQEAAQ